MTVRTGPLTLATGSAHMTQHGTLEMDTGVTHALSTRGVSVVDVVPCADHIDVTTHIRFLGDVRVRLRRVDTA